MKLQYCIALIGTLLLVQSTHAQNDKSPIIIGERFSVESDILNQERDIWIGLPQGYDTSAIRYPVHFLLDAEITFESFCGVTDIMSLAGQIPEVIVVGIPNVNQFFDMNPKENAEHFLDFIVNELTSIVEKEYRTNGQKLICGYSTAGNFVIYALLNKYDSFNSFLSGSPYMLSIYQDHEFVIKLKDEDAPRSLYTSMGSNDRQDQLEFFKSFCENLDQKPHVNLNFKYDISESRDHNNNILPNWQNGLEFIYRDWNNGE